MNDTELALYLTKALSYYHNQRWMGMVPVLQEEAVAYLATPNLLSVRAIAAIVGCTEHRVRTVWPLDTPMTKHRGTLDPSYLTTIAYLLSGVKVDHVLIDEMLSACAVGMVARLTNKSDDTLQRWRKR